MQHDSLALLAVAATLLVAYSNCSLTGAAPLCVQAAAVDGITNWLLMPGCLAAQCCGPHTLAAGLPRLSLLPSSQPLFFPRGPAQAPSSSAPSSHGAAPASAPRPRPPQRAATSSHGQPWHTLPAASSCYSFSYRAYTAWGLYPHRRALPAAAQCALAAVAATGTCVRGCRCAASHP